MIVKLDFEDSVYIPPTNEAVALAKRLRCEVQESWDAHNHHPPKVTHVRIHGTTRRVRNLSELMSLLVNVSTTFPRGVQLHYEGEPPMLTVTILNGEEPE